MAEGELGRIGWPALAEHPRFREAAELNARLILEQKDGYDPFLRWLSNDLGRTSSLTRVLILHARRGEATVAELLAKIRVRNTTSKGRALQLLRRAEAAGLIEITPRTGHWRERRLVPQRKMIDRWRARAQAEIASASLVLPQAAPALLRLDDDAFFFAFLAELDRFDGMAPQVRGPANPAIRYFLAREGGLMMLYDLMLRQEADRDRLLMTAPFSRTRLARRLRVSRTHVRLLFTEAEAAGWLACDSGRIAFSPAMSEEAERHFALTFHALGTSAAAALAVRAGGRAAELQTV